MAYARRVISTFEKDQIAGFRTAGRSADVVKPLGPQAAHVPAGVIDDPGHEAGAVKGCGRGAPAPHIGIAQIFFRLGENGRESFIVQIFSRYFIINRRLCVFVHIFRLREQVWPVAKRGHIQGIPGHFLLAHKLQGEMGKVAVFSAQQKTKSVQDRVEGFMNNIGKYGDIEVVETIYSDQVDDMEASMKEVLEKYPTLDGVFCTNADITEMYLNLEKSDEHDAPALVGVDATTKQQEAIRNGEEIGCVSQQPYAMGYQTIWAAVETTAPKKSVVIEKNVLSNPAWIDADCLDDPDYSGYLYTE